MDPFVDLIRLLRPRATLWRQIQGAGRWGVRFRARKDLLFCWVAEGTCLLTRPSLPAPVLLRQGDFVLVRTSSPFALVSDLAATPESSERAFAALEGSVLRVGNSDMTPEVRLHGGRFVFAPDNEDLLTELLPALMHVTEADEAGWRVQSLLRMNAAESDMPGPGSQFVIARLMELLLVEILRTEALRTEERPTGLLAGLADPVTARALHAMHDRVSQAWTVASLGRLAGVSRSSFASRFRAVVGLGPMEYLGRWRMAIAKDALRRGDQSMAEVAFAVGFQSSSAFSTAFRKAVGCSPKQFARPGEVGLERVVKAPRPKGAAA